MNWPAFPKTNTSIAIVIDTFLPAIIVNTIAWFDQYSNLNMFLLSIMSMKIVIP
ncbi:hypothetical protein [Staphylothermus hellenicus]|uniref:hypothetical protein n=1 Tax=Staphylothermus hellenicus TaxID=84599 RepID=UPI00164F14FB|nr:hypothetical protein [Staphylothermus hellenicus]